ncbi:hypothetical protein FOB22_001451 [Saccharomyces cerevisiae]|nr:hypothetical protein FOB22_001451 [Saccharomyces cerevisiae]
MGTIWHPTYKVLFTDMYDMMNKKDRLGDVLATAQRIRRRYNKNGSSEPRLKTLDGLTSERWIQWLGLESDYHCSFSSTRNAED